MLFRFVPGQLHFREVVRIWERSRPISSQLRLDASDGLQSDLGPSLRNLPQDLSHPTRRPCTALVYSKSRRCPTDATSKGFTNISFFIAGRQDATNTCDRAHARAERQRGPSERPPEGLRSRHCNGNSSAKAASRGHGMIGKRTVSSLEACCLVLPCSTAAGRAWTVLPSHKCSRPLRDVAGRTAASVIRPCGGQY